MRSFKAGNVLNLSKFSLLHSLVLLVDFLSVSYYLRTVVKLLRHREPHPPLHDLTLLFYDPYAHSHEKIEMVPTEISGPGACRTYCNEIDSILGDEQRDSEDTVVSITFKCSQVLPRCIVNRLTGIFQAGLPKLHGRGSLKTAFFIGGMLIGTVMTQLRACLH